MSFKEFFINSDENKGTQPLPTVQPTNNVTQPVIFPSNPSPQFPSNSQPIVLNQTNRFLNDIINVYDNGFTKLNKPGYDFFEFYKAVNKGGVDNPQVYVMAFEMASAMDTSVTKTTLISQSDYYISELEKVHKSFSSDGTRKIQELSNNKDLETSTLTTDITVLKQQLEQITNSLLEKQKQLSEIDNKYSPTISEINEKLSANNMAKDMLVSNINKVKNNININLN